MVVFGGFFVIECSPLVVMLAIDDSNPTFIIERTMLHPIQCWLLFRNKAWPYRDRVCLQSSRFRTDIQAKIRVWGYRRVQTKMQVFRNPFFRRQVDFRQYVTHGTVDCFDIYLANKSPSLSRKCGLLLFFGFSLALKILSPSFFDGSAGGEFIHHFQEDRRFPLSSVVSFIQSQDDSVSYSYIIVITVL